MGFGCVSAPGSRWEERFDLRSNHSIKAGPLHLAQQGCQDRAAAWSSEFQPAPVRAAAGQLHAMDATLTRQGSAGAHVARQMRPQP